VKTASKVKSQEDLLLRKHNGVPILLSVFSSSSDPQILENVAAVLAHVAAASPKLASKLAQRGAALGLIREIPALVRNKSRSEKALHSVLQCLADIAAHETQFAARAAATNSLLPLLAFVAECHAPKALTPALRVLTLAGASSENMAILVAAGAVNVALRLLGAFSQPAAFPVLEPCFALLSTLVRLFTGRPYNTHVVHILT
jgi:hypothetical protein